MNSNDFTLSIMQVTIVLVIYYLWKYTFRSLSCAWPLDTRKMFWNPYQIHPIPSPRTLYSNSDINDTAHTKRGSTQQKRGRNKRAIFSGSFRVASVRLCSKCLFGCETMAPVTKNNTTTSTGMDLLFCDVIVGSADTTHTGREPLPLVL